MGKRTGKIIGFILVPLAAGLLAVPSHELKTSLERDGKAIDVTGCMASPLFLVNGAKTVVLQVSENGRLCGNVTCVYSFLNYPRVLIPLDEQRILVAYQADIKFLVGVLEIKAVGHGPGNISSHLRPFFVSSFCDIRSPTREEVAQALELMERNRQGIYKAMSPTLWFGRLKLVWDYDGLKKQFSEWGSRQVFPVRQKAKEVE